MQQVYLRNQPTGLDPNYKNKKNKRIQAQTKGPIITFALMLLKCLPFTPSLQCNFIIDSDWEDEELSKIKRPLLTEFLRNAFAAIAILMLSINQS